MSDELYGLSIDRSDYDQLSHLNLLLLHENFKSVKDLSSHKSNISPSYYNIRELRASQKVRKDLIGIDFGEIGSIIPQSLANISPIDPLYESSYHIFSSYSSPSGSNIRGAWNLATGKGITISIVDDGLDRTHSDIKDSYISDGSYDWNDNDNDPYPVFNADRHGTACAGLAIATTNIVCSIGAAPAANVTGQRLIAEPTTAAQDAAALNWKPQINDIYSNSWGPSDNGEVHPTDPIVYDALKWGVTHGRSGLGSIYVWAAGNGGIRDNSNLDGFTSLPFVIAVTSVDSFGRKASFSEPGSNILIASPGTGLTTTDISGFAGYSSGDCYSSFSGTSASAPLVAGIAALVLETRPDLTWRDVQYILALSSEINDPTSSTWFTNGAGHRLSLYYGWGTVSAVDAVILARSWTLLGPASNKTIGPISFTEGTSLSSNEQTFSTSFTFGQEQLSTPQHVIERVIVQVNLTHARPADLEITLNSPSGTLSVLKTTTRANTDEQYIDFHSRLSSIHFWGESPVGDWTLSIQDMEDNNLDGQIFSAQLTITTTEETNPQQHVRRTSTAQAIDLCQSSEAPCGDICTIWECQIESPTTNNCTNTTIIEADGSLCEDGIFCNGVETCQDGYCQPSAEPACPSSNELCIESTTTCASSCSEVICDEPPISDICAQTLGVCNQTSSEVAPVCEYGPKPDGSPCTNNNVFCDGAEVCLAGVCSSLGDPCSKGLICQEESRICAAINGDEAADEMDNNDDDNASTFTTIIIPIGVAFVFFYCAFVIAADRLNPEPDHRDKDDLLSSPLPSPNYTSRSLQDDAIINI